MDIRRIYQALTTLAALAAVTLVIGHSQGYGGYVAAAWSACAGAVAVVIGSTWIIQALRHGPGSADRDLGALRSRVARGEVVGPADVEALWERARGAWSQEEVTERRDGLVRALAEGGPLREAHARLLMLDREPTEAVRAAVLAFARSDAGARARAASVEWLGDRAPGETTCEALLALLDDRDEEVAAAAVTALGLALPREPAAHLVAKLRARRAEIERRLGSVKQVPRERLVRVLLI